MNLQENDGVVKIQFLDLIVSRREISRCVAWNSTSQLDYYPREALQSSLEVIRFKDKLFLRLGAECKFHNFMPNVEIQ